MVDSFHVRPILIHKVQEAQFQDPSLDRMREKSLDSSQGDFSSRSHGTLLFRNRLVVPSVQMLRHEILEEPHSSS